MEQRRPRLGDILDDYCPRERRITNHAVVAMIDDEVKQTRCVTCDAEHVYKGAKVPSRRRRKDAPAALYNQVLAGLPEVPASEGRGGPAAERAPGPPPRIAAAAPERTPHVEAAETTPAAAGAPDRAPGGVEDGPVHRPLIRATLPRPEGQAPARPVPEFTIRQAGRNGNYREADPRHGMRPRGAGNGARSPGTPGAPRFGRPARMDARGRQAPFSHAPGSRPPDRAQPHARPSRPGRPARFGRKRSK
jgi:hypothetical protein